ncbi:MAG TPA: hypothetical protein VIC82_11580, partial [Candidatus Nanopelagicales bacterium]
TLGVVDETVAELALDDATMPPPLAAYDPGIVTVGGASKIFWGGLRLGWLRAPADQVAMLTEVRVAFDLGAPVLEQLALIRMLEALPAARVARAKAMVTARDALASALRTQLPGWRFAVPTGGLSLWVQLPAPRSSALVAAAEDEGLLLASGGQFAVEGGLESFLRLPFTMPPETLVNAVSRLARAWDRMADSPARTRRSAPLVA